MQAFIVSGLQKGHGRWLPSRRLMAAACRGVSPGITRVDGLVSGSPANDLDIAVDPNHVSKDGLPLIDADTFSKLLAEVSTHYLTMSAWSLG